MSKKELIIIGGLAILAILQSSFAPHFPLFNNNWFIWINPVNIAVAVITLFEKRKNRFAWIAAFWAGFFMNIYSGLFFGFWILVYLGFVAIVKLIVKRYVWIPSFW